MPRTLPPEILRMTFEKVSDKSTLCNILLACQQFRQLVESARVYADAAFSKHPIRFKLDSFLKAIEGPRALFVRSLTFDAEDIRYHELKVIDEILMKTPNLKALCLERRTLPHVRFLQNPPFLLTKLEFRDIPLDTPTVRFLEAQTSLEFLSIRTHVGGPLSDFSPSAFPNLKTLVTECKVLDCLASVPLNITHLYIKLSGYFSFGSPQSRRLDSVLVLACHMESSYFTTLCVNTEWLELHGIMDASSDLAIVLRTCQRHTLRGIRLVISPYAPIQLPVQFQQRFDEAPSLEFVEVCNTTGQHDECRRWYRDSPQPVKIRWKCQRGSEWQADWLKDVVIVEGTNNLVET